MLLTSSNQAKWESQIGSNFTDIQKLYLKNLYGLYNGMTHIANSWKELFQYRLKFPVAKYLQGNNQKHNAHHVSQKRFNQVILCQSSGKNTLMRTVYSSFT